MFGEKVASRALSRETGNLRFCAGAEEYIRRMASVHSEYQSCLEKVGEHQGGQR